MVILTPGSYVIKALLLPVADAAVPAIVGEWCGFIGLVIGIAAVDAWLSSGRFWVLMVEKYFDSKLKKLLR